MMNGPFRVASAAGMGIGIDSSKGLRVRFNGRSLAGFAGDTLASVLLANGVRVVGRSFKFHRPRGIYSCGVEEPNGFVELGHGASAVPSARATLVAAEEGLETFVRSGWPSVGFDLGRVLDLVSPLWAAGFYNKTFMWPGWHLYESVIRRLAGFGTAPAGPDPDRYEAQNAHCDVLVIGGGASGLRAARQAGEDGARVILAERDSLLGGRAAWSGIAIDGMPGADWVRRMSADLSRRDTVRTLLRTSAVGVHGAGVVTLVQTADPSVAGPGRPRERYWIVRAPRIVLAAGAIEQPLVFCNNDRPGIVLAGSAHQYLRRYAVAVGRRVLIATNNDSAYAFARDLKLAGLGVEAVVDTRDSVSDELQAAMNALSVPVLKQSMPVNTEGFGALSGVTVARLARGSQAIEHTHRVACDALAVSGGWSPALHLFSQAGGALTYRDGTAVFKSRQTHPDVLLAGSAAGQSDRTAGELGSRISPVGDTSRQWVDLRHDVTVADLELAVRENYTSVEHVKRYTTVGMAADQGKTSSLATVDVLSRLRNRKPALVGHTTLRPPFTAVTLGAIAGRAVGEHFAPTRRTSLHAWHASHGALLEHFGEWERPAAYLRAGESRVEASRREARAVRTTAGLFDGSPLGKIEVRGPDALEFLDHFYINDLRTVRPARARYGFMLRETGVIFDDGTIVMLAPDRFLITTTSGNAGRVAAWLEEWQQCEWPHLRVAITPVTEQWATLSLSGPRSREVLSHLVSGVDLSSSQFPHLDVRDARVLGRVARIYRVSFTGELTYEINVPAGAAREIWEAVIEAGKPFELQPYGIDALQQLRLEKGFLHIGTDTDGTTVPDDIGWGGVAAKKQAEFIGQRSLKLADNVRPDRLQLVGLTSGEDIPVGAHLRVGNSAEATDGWVTSAGRSVLTGQPVALAVLRGGRARMDEAVTLHDGGVVTHGRIVPTPFFDPRGERLHV